MVGKDLGNLAASSTLHPPPRDLGFFLPLWEAIGIFRLSLIFFLLPSSFIKNTCFLLSRGLREGGLRFSALNQFRSGTGTFFPAQPSSMWFPASFTPWAAARKVGLSRLAFICCEISPVCFFWKKKLRGKQPNNEGFEDTFSAQQSTLCCREVEHGFWMSKGFCCVFS